MSLQMIPDQNDRPLEMPPQLLQHGNDDRFIDRVMRPEKMIAAEMVTMRRNTDHANGRETLVMLQLMPQHRRVSAQRPRALDRRQRQKACFVPENDYCVLSARFFLMRGQSHSSQCVMASSFRSRARHSGFCGVKRSALSRVGT